MGRSAPLGRYWKLTMYFMRAFPLRLEPELWPFSFQLTVNIAALAYRALENPGTRSLNAADSSALTVAEIGAFLFTTLQRAAALCPRVSPSIVFGPIAIGPVFLKRDAASFCARCPQRSASPSHFQLCSLSNTARCRQSNSIPRQLICCCCFIPHLFLRVVWPPFHYIDTAIV